MALCIAGKHTKARNAMQNRCSFEMVKMKNPYGNSEVEIVGQSSSRGGKRNTRKNRKASRKSRKSRKSRRN